MSEYGRSAADAAYAEAAKQGPVRLHKRLSDQEAEQLKDQAMANRKERRAGNGEGAQKNGFAKMLEGIKEAAEKAKANVPQGSDDFDLPMPDIQTIEQNVIRWEWYRTAFLVSAIYYKSSKKYLVKVGRFGTVSPIDGKETDVWEMTGPDCKGLGEILCAAYKWEHTWEHHAGVYLANGGKLPEGNQVEFSGGPEIDDVGPEPQDRGGWTEADKDGEDDDS